ncbi:MAG: hypothetical protein IT439_02865 [Phycisphaerales bacterium]|nr:hypothetical protein [Phycisphaerales bacterium]
MAKKAKKKAKKKAAKKGGKKKAKKTTRKAASRPAKKGAKKAAKKTKKKAAKKKARRTVMYSSAGKKLYAVRSADGQFKDIQTYQRAHAADLRQSSDAEEAAPTSAPSNGAPGMG